RRALRRAARGRPHPLLPGQRVRALLLRPLRPLARPGGGACRPVGPRAPGGGRAGAGRSQPRPPGPLPRHQPVQQGGGLPPAPSDLLPRLTSILYDLIPLLLDRDFYLGANPADLDDYFERLAR